MNDRGYGYSGGYYPGGYANYSGFSDYYGDPGHENNRKMQSKILLSKQEIAQIQDTELSNDTMCRVLTLGEKFACCENIKYGAYNMSSATGFDLLRLFVREIEIFRLSYQDYIEEYKTYSFPKNLSKNEILADIKSWMKLVEPEYVKYYRCLYDLIDGNYKFSLKDEIAKLKTQRKKKPNYIEGEKAKNLMAHVPTISHYSKGLAKKAEENYMNDKNYVPEVNLSNKKNQQMYNKLSKNAHSDEVENEEDNAYEEEDKNL